jgi:hypothetical protein
MSPSKNTSTGLVNFKINGVTFMPTKRKEGLFKKPYIVVKYNSSSAVAIHSDPRSITIDNHLQTDANMHSYDILQNLEKALNLNRKATLRAREGYQDSNGGTLFELRVPDTQENLDAIKSFLQNLQKTSKEHFKESHFQREETMSSDTSQDTQITQPKIQQNSLTANRDKGKDISK